MNNTAAFHSIGAREVPLPSRFPGDLIELALHLHVQFRSRGHAFHSVPQLLVEW
jgi:hypothetical protein